MSYRINAQTSQGTRTTSWVDTRFLWVALVVGYGRALWALKEGPAEFSVVYLDPTKPPYLQRLK